MSEIQVPVRETTQTYRCRCVLLDSRDLPEDEDGRCPKHTSGPDAPFCEECEKRHLNMPFYITVTVWTGP